MPQKTTLKTLLKSKKTESFLYPIVVLALVFGLQIYASITKKEIFPFAPFRMYSYGFSGDNLSLVRIFCTTKEGQENLLSSYRLVKVESYYTTDISDILDAKGMLDSSDVEKIRFQTSSLRRETEGICSHLKVYKLTWDHFEGRLRDHPTSKEFILEL